MWFSDPARTSERGKNRLLCAGYNILDDYIYGLKSRDFVRLAADGSYIMLGKPTGVGSAAGACTPPTLSKRVSKKYVSPGEQFTYDFKLTNPFTNPLVVQLTDDLEPYLTFVSGSISPANPGGGTVTTLNSDTLVVSNITIPAGLPPNNEVTNA